MAGDPRPVPFSKWSILRRSPHFTWRRLCGERQAVQGRVLDGHSWPTRHVQGANTGQSPDGDPIALFLSRVVIWGWVGRLPLLRHNDRGSSRTERLQRWAAAGRGTGQESCANASLRTRELRYEATVDFVPQKLWDRVGRRCLC